ncbi:hotdog domain-containing protein [uncultured Campylobacter sp.]|uniref:acyl-CoA thioesterase n=1 Tax=uncultured Campylobacter sp. TaxID=218934 RepID=UPI0026165943|nr:hotdog domain-containing protein [uncultured Campylobacter sp.]
MKDAQIKIIAMPSDKIGDKSVMSSGWITKIFDLAAGVVVKELTQNRSVTIAMDKIHFKKPILVGDYVLCYADIVKLGKSSIEIDMRIDVKRLCDEGFCELKDLASAKAIFVSLDKNGKKIILSEELKKKLHKQ